MDPERAQEQTGARSRRGVVGRISGMISRGKTAQAAVDNQRGGSVAQSQTQVAAPIAGGSADPSQPPQSSCRPATSAIPFAPALPSQSRHSLAATSMPSTSLGLISREPHSTVHEMSLAERVERLEVTRLSREALEHNTRLRLEALKQAVQREAEWRSSAISQPEQWVEELKAQIAERMDSLTARVSALETDVAALKKDTATMREQASALKATCDGIADLVVPAQSWLTRKDPAGDIARIEKQVELLTKAQRDASLKQRMTLHLVHDDFADALHAAALEYHAALPAYLARLCDVDLASDDEKAEVLEAKQDWERLVQWATELCDSWVKRKTRKGQVPSALLMQDRLVWQTMDLLRSQDDLRFFFQKHGVDAWALMLWTAVRQIIKNRPFADSPSSQTSAGTSGHSSVQTAVAVFRPFLSGFEGAAPEGTTPLTTLFRQLGAIQVTTVGAPVRSVLASTDILDSAAEESVEDRLREIFHCARVNWELVG